MDRHDNRKHAITSSAPTGDPFLAASPDIASRLSDRPRAFLAGRDFIEHARFVVRRMRLWQILSTAIMFYCLERLNSGIIAPTFGPYALGLVFGPLFEEGVKAWSLRSHAGRRIFGAGLAISFPIIEMLRSYYLINQMDALTWGLVILRVPGILLHLYTHFVQAYRLSFFGRRNRTIGSFATAVLIHSGFNAAMSICTLIIYG